VPGENPEQFTALIESLTAEYQPETEMQKIVVDEAARAIWELARVNREFDKSQQELYSKQQNMRDWDAGQHAEFERMLRYRTKAERAYGRAFQAVEYLRKLRLQAQQRAFWEKLQEAKLDQGDRRIKLSTARMKQTTEPKEREPKEKDKAPRPIAWPAPLVPLSQVIEVRVSQGIVSVNVHPSAEEMRQHADAAAAGAPVLRRFEFPDGVPPEYAWVNEPGMTRSGIVWTQRFDSVQSWRTHADREAANAEGGFLPAKNANDA